MTHRISVPAFRLATLLLASAASCTPSKPPAAGSEPSHDSAHAAHTAMQRRGAEAMGVDQETSVHVFEALPNGGIIELQRAVDDSAGMRAIRAHLRGIGQAFALGDFSTPEYIHMTTVPGARVMAERRTAIKYDYRDLPRGGALRIATNDAVARQAIWEFIAYQRNEHMAEEARRVSP
jgi:hypothetical protein